MSLPDEALKAAEKALARVHCTHTLGWSCMECRARAAVDAAMAALTEAGMVVVSAEDLRTYLDRGKNLPAEVSALNRLRAAVPKEADQSETRGHAGHHCGNCEGIAPETCINFEGGPPPGHPDQRDSQSERRQRYAEAIMARIAQAVIVVDSTVADMVGRQPGDATEHDLADAVLAVRDEEMAALRERAEKAVGLLRDLIDADDGWFDHHGGCQAHGYLSLEPGERCPHAEAKEMLSALDGTEGWPS